MIFGLIRKWRRRRLLAAPEPVEWHDWLAADLPFYGQLTRDEQRRLREQTRVFLAEKTFEARDGLELTDRIKLSIAAQACLLTLNLSYDGYRRVARVIVFASTFGTPGREGLVVTDRPTLGVVHYGGPVALAWDATQGGAINPEDGHNVVFHEFAHKLDLADHLADGTPPMDGRDLFERWVGVMTERYEALREDFDKGRRNVLDHFGAQNPAEFFAVATETFFEKGDSLARRMPDLYDVLREYYRQDPAQWR